MLIDTWKSKGMTLASGGAVAAGAEDRAALEEIMEQHHAMSRMMAVSDGSSSAHDALVEALIVAAVENPSQVCSS